jgi:hypothetical protein
MQQYKNSWSKFSMWPVSGHEETPLTGALMSGSRPRVQSQNGVGFQFVSASWLITYFDKPVV